LCRSIALLAVFAALSDAAVPASAPQLAFAPALALREGIYGASSAMSTHRGNALGTSAKPLLAGGRAARMPPLKMAVYGDEEQPKAMTEIKQFTVPKMDPATLKAWIIKWPTGTTKDAFGLPKLMLPISAEANDQGLKMVFKGSLDPWIQVVLELDTVRIYRCSGLSTSALSVSALKQREEGKICDKLGEDLQKLGNMTEKTIPQVKKAEPEPEAKEEDEGAAEPAAEGADTPPAASSEGKSDEPPLSPA